MFEYDRFDALRRSRGITKKFIAQSLNRSPALCQDWKQRKSHPSPAQLARISEILDTTPAYLCGETDDPSPEAADELAGLIDILREREDMRLLFKLASASSPDTIRQAVRIIEALRQDD